MSSTLRRLSELANGTLHNPQDLEISDIGLNSAKLPENGLFAALPGTRTHGASYAAATPASAILTDKDGWDYLHNQGETRPVIEVEDIRAILGQVAAEIYGHASKELTLIGVTGTAGKTTITYLLEAGLAHLGVPTGVIGTTGTHIKGQKVDTPLTTPEAPMLQQLFRHMVEEGVTHVVMEVSSHALSLGRVNGCDFDVAGFSNLSQDHLDYHPTMEDYFQAKATFFRPGSPVEAHQSIICIDDKWGQRMATEVAEHPITVSTEGHVADIQASNIRVDDAGIQHATISLPNTEPIELKLAIPGRFNIANAAIALGCAQAAGLDPAQVAEGIGQVAVPGRMEKIEEGQDFLAVVDYAHKPAAVAAVLDTLRSQISGRLGIVLGAGGNRDHSKRPIMGAEAAKRCELVIITDDNPRDEDPASIRQEMLSGIDTDTEVQEIADRRAAIRAAVAWAQPGDAIVVAGKGHETGQLIAGVTHPFDDREELRAALKEREG